MSRYRKIDPRIWNDAKFRKLGDDGQLAFMFVLTHPSMTSLGAMRATVEGLAAERAWPPQRFADAIRDAIADGMLEVNRDASYMGVPNFLKYNEPEGPNSVIKAWVEALDLIPECPEKSKLASRCRLYLSAKTADFQSRIGGVLDAMQDAMQDAMRDACPIQEQEQEQEQELTTPLTPRGGDPVTAAVVPVPAKPRRRQAKVNTISAIPDVQDRHIQACGEMRGFWPKTDGTDGRRVGFDEATLVMRLIHWEKQNPAFTMEVLVATGRSFCATPKTRYPAPEVYFSKTPPQDDRKAHFLEAAQAMVVRMRFQASRAQALVPQESIPEIPAPDSVAS